MPPHLQSTSLDESPIGEERFRPHFHFTPRRNWINDPNGLVYFDGEYHLFYQYNPKGMDWGNMCWGHAVSTDLLRWEELPVAIPETDQMIFSGSIIVDHDDASGLGTGDAPPLLAFFTAYDEARGIQSQHLAYSHDRGRSFAHYAGNPILDFGLADFRDPKVFYHAASRAWIMVVALARDHIVQFYRSENLLDWTLAGAFGPAGSTSGQWECPDLFALSCDGNASDVHWVLKVDVDVGLIDGGSGAQYFIGDFDGHTFRQDLGRSDPAGAIADHGPDFYAAITWANLPDTRPDPVWIGWQSNHQSGKVYPTDPWRGAMTLPRALFLFEEDGKVLLGQRPACALPGAGDAVENGEHGLATGETLSLANASASFERRLTLRGGAAAQVSLTLADAQATLLALAIDFDRREISVARPVSPLSPQDAFCRAVKIPMARADMVTFDILFDGSLLEIFVDEGRRVYSACIFPAGSTTFLLESTVGQASVERSCCRAIAPLMHSSSR